MLDIPTARTNLQARRTARQTAAPETGSFGLGTQPASSSPLTPQLTAGPGMTSIPEAPPTALSQTTPYEYGGQGWNDPVAQSVMKDYFSTAKWDTGSAPGMYDQSMNIAQAYNDKPGVLHSPLDPASWGTTYRGQEYTDIADKYKAAGGTYFNQFTPAQQAGVPYYAATGQPAPVMNMQRGVAETPTVSPTGKVRGQTPTPVGGTGSYNTLAPDVVNRMWR